MKGLTKKQIETIRKSTNFDVQVYEDEYYFSYYSPCGEDFGFGTSKDNAIQEIVDYAQSFDADEHAASWYGANRGEPSSLRDLLDDAEDIANNLNELSDLVSTF